MDTQAQMAGEYTADNSRSSRRTARRRSRGNSRRNSGSLLPVIGKWIAFACLIALIVSELTGNKVSTAKFEDVEKAVESAVDLTTMQKADNQIIRRLYHLTPTDYEGIVLYYPVSNMGAEEMLLVKLRNEDQSDTVKDAIVQRLATQKNNFEGYGADQTAMLNKSIIDLHGNYILFICSSDPTAVQKAFENAL